VLKILKNNKMAIDPQKKKKRIKVKIKAGQEAPSIPVGYEKDPSKSKSGKDIYIKKTTTVTPSAGVGREATAAEKKAMVEGTFYSSNKAQYRDGESVKTDKSEFIVKKKEPKFKEEGPSFTGKEKREARRAERQMRCAGKKFSVGCKVGSGRISRARY
jgi:hypothetical protein